jgi:hypothetical protein
MSVIFNDVRLVEEFRHSVYNREIFIDDYQQRNSILEKANDLLLNCLKEMAEFDLDEAQSFVDESKFSSEWDDSFHKGLDEMEKIGLTPAYANGCDSDYCDCDECYEFHNE